MFAPPPQCIACGRPASIDPGQLTCAACGAELPPRREAGPPLVIPTLPSPPPICGTALLAMDRIAKLRATADRVAIEAALSDEGLVVRLSLGEPGDGGIDLPATIGVIAIAEGAKFPGFSASTDVVLAARTRAECVVPARGLAPGGSALVYLCHLGSLYERIVPIAAA